jgi:hypothetical protein
MDEATERKFELAAGLMHCISRNGAMVEILSLVIRANVGVIHPKGSFAKDIRVMGSQDCFIGSITLGASTANPWQVFVVG